MAIEIEITPWEEAQAIAFPIREAVFVQEQQVPANLELDEFDPIAWHALAKLKGADVGTARLLPDGKIGRMAVLKPYRLQRVGSALLNALLIHGELEGIKQFYLSAQIDALYFYEKFGFEMYGPQFEEAGIRHIEMRLFLK
ncbi:MAG: GNAT family N-acetyltransferase [Polynucleobacter sp.]|nr:GNAT family N-acetyltransferase [Polynucleobacter sp.]